ncbi:MAG: DUF899 family protein [Woeseiaceae bacterium]|nr:DUF899 family protein [Woeseiaceae bacterium]
MTTFRFPNETDAYRQARNDLLDAEVELRAHIEAVAAQRRRLPPGGKVAEDYRFERPLPDGGAESVTLDALFGEHDSLLIYTMMFGAEWDAPCPSCASIVDSINANARAVAETSGIAVVAAATADQIRDWSRRRHWTMDIVSGAGSSYILDYAGFETDDPGLVSCMNAFRRTADGIFHFWASELLSRPMDNGHPRHVDSIWPMWNLLDMTPQGRGDAIIPKQDYEHRYFTQHVLGES